MAKQVRQLAAILFSDIVGYTAMMQRDETNAILSTKRYIEVLRYCVQEHGGEILNDYGDGSLCTFGSATNAVRCALELQKQFQLDPKVPLRIGLHVGEILLEDGKAFGDGVNIASRIQSLGVANSILFSSEIKSKIKNQEDLNSVSLGRFHFKNVDEEEEVFALSSPGLVIPDKKNMQGKLQEKKNLRKKLLIAGAIILIGVISFLAYNKFSRSAGFTGEKSIAVLPFDQSGATNLEEYLSDGITQDVINNLSKITAT
jgi:adenylate cyclase